MSQTQKIRVYIILLIVLSLFVIVCCKAAPAKFYFNVSGTVTSFNDHSAIGMTANVGVSLNKNTLSFRNSYITGGQRFYFYEFMAIEHNYNFNIGKTFQLFSIASISPLTTMTMNQSSAVLCKNNKRMTSCFGIGAKCRIRDAYFVTIALKSHVMGVSSSDHKTGIESKKVSVIPFLSIGIGK